MAHLQVNSVAPNIARNGSATAIQIYGAGFESAPQVRVGQTDCLNVVRVNANLITCDVPADIFPGNYDLTVMNSGGHQDVESLIGAIQVTYDTPTLPFPLESREAIINRMRTVLTDDWDTNPGSFMYDFLSAVAYEYINVQVKMSDMVSLFFTQYARGGWLDLIGEMFGLLREEAQKATGTLTVTGTNGIEIPVGTLFSNTVVYGSGAKAVTYASTAVATISGGSASVSVQAVEAGESGNLAIGLVSRLTSPLAGIGNVTNAAAMTGGTSRENDDDYRVRLLNFVRNPVAGGNKQDYETWAFEVDNVGSVSVVPLARGNGTVDVYILDSDLGIPDSELLEAVQDYIAPSPADEGGGKAPIGADVLIKAPSAVEIGVTVTIVVASGYSSATVEAAVEAAITSYIQSLNIGEDVVYVHVANVVHDTEGVANYSSLQVNSGTADISIDADKVATAGTINASA